MCSRKTAAKSSTKISARGNLRDSVSGLATAA
jgi:hypothetical protein